MQKNTKAMVAKIEAGVRQLRGERVLLDVDLARLYGVATGALVRAVKRNLDRFPPDFMFQLDEREFADLRCQAGISNRGGRRYRPHAFTEQGVAMLSSVLRSRRASQINIEIMRVFVRLRHMVQSHENLARRLDELERKCDGRFKVVFAALRADLQSESPSEPKRARIGFRRDADDEPASPPLRRRRT